VLVLLKKGVSLDDGPTNPARVRIIETQQGRSVVRITFYLQIIFSYSIRLYIGIYSGG